MPMRSFESVVPSELWSTIQRGTLQTRYRGRLFLKSPFDAILYLQLIQQLRPRTIIEIGSKEGGSALWFADMLMLHGIEARVLTIDRQTPELVDPRITLLQGDANDLHAVLPDSLLRTLPHPFLISEDSAHTLETSLAVLHFFDRHLLTGDRIVIEDGVVDFLPESLYCQYENGPNRAVADFLKNSGDRYAIDHAFCDYFGTNVTYNPNGWLRRV